MRILHVTESMGGGTAAALTEFVRSTPEYEHHVVYLSRQGSAIGVDMQSLFVSSHDAESGLSNLRRSTIHAISLVSPDIVHMHSSWAGLIGRLISRRCLRGARLAYSPHCFYFERRDISLGLRIAARSLEFLLSFRTDAIIAVSPHEATLARGFLSKVYIVPNTTRRTASVIDEQAKRHSFSVVTIGRICAQKDPSFFCQVVRKAKIFGTPLNWTWIGSGDLAWEKELRNLGVEVTGWIDETEISRRLRSARIYLHTARWESCPMSLLEAAASYTDIVARSIPPLVSMGLPDGFTSPDAVARRIQALTRDATREMGVDGNQDVFRERHSNDAQRAALLAVYDALSVSR